jgi:hypothetical protein
MQVSTRKNHKNINIFQDISPKSSELVNKYISMLFSKINVSSDSELALLMRYLNSVLIHHLANHEEHIHLAKVMVFTNLEEALYLAPVILSL